jgi:hypothetical protein
MGGFEIRSETNGEINNMATSNQDRLRIFENVLARTSGGRDTLNEFAKAMSGINGLQTFQELNPPMASNEPVSAPMSGQPMQGVNPMSNMP